MLNCIVYCDPGWYPSPYKCLYPFPLIFLVRDVVFKWPLNSWASVSSKEFWGLRERGNFSLSSSLLLTFPGYFYFFLFSPAIRNWKRKLWIWISWGRFNEFVSGNWDSFVNWNGDWVSFGYNVGVFYYS